MKTQTRQGGRGRGDDPQRGALDEDWPGCAAGVQVAPELVFLQSSGRAGAQRRLRGQTNYEQGNPWTQPSPALHVWVGDRNTVLSVPVL